MTKIQNYIPAGIVLGASFVVIISVLASSSQAIYAQPQGKSTSTTPATNASASNMPLAAKDVSFNGKSVKILFVSNFFDKTDWKNIDSLVSTGYDIKAITPVQGPKALAYFVVLQSK